MSMVQGDRPHSLKYSATRVSGILKNIKSQSVLNKTDMRQWKIVDVAER